MRAGKYELQSARSQEGFMSAQGGKLGKRHKEHSDWREGRVRDEGRYDHWREGRGGELREQDGEEWREVRRIEGDDGRGEVQLLEGEEGKGKLQRRGEEKSTTIRWRGMEEGGTTIGGEGRIVYTIWRERREEG